MPCLGAVPLFPAPRPNSGTLARGLQRDGELQRVVHDEARLADVQRLRNRARRGALVHHLLQDEAVPGCGVLNKQREAAVRSALVGAALERASVRRCNTSHTF